MKVSESPGKLDNYRNKPGEVGLHMVKELHDQEINVNKSEAQRGLERRPVTVYLVLSLVSMHMCE